MKFAIYLSKLSKPKAVTELNQVTQRTDLSGKKKNTPMFSDSGLNIKIPQCETHILVKKVVKF